MSVLNGNVDKAKVAAPETPFIYYGEEVGMQGQKPDEDIRLPMQWTADAATAGFTSGAPWRNPGANTSSMNVAAEDKNKDSLLNHYRALLTLRNTHSALRTGDLILLEAGNSAVYAILRRDGNESVLITINLSDKPVSNYQLSLADTLLRDGTHSVQVIFGTGNASSLQVNSGKFTSYRPKPELAPFETLVILLK